MFLVEDRSTTHYTPAFLNNKAGVLDMGGLLLRENILDTDAAKVMVNKSFATAMGIHAAHLDQHI